MLVISLARLLSGFHPSSFFSFKPNIYITNNIKNKFVLHQHVILALNCISISERFTKLVSEFNQLTDRLPS